MLRGQMLLFLHSEEFRHDDMGRVVATPPIIYFIFGYQKLNFKASLVIQINNLYFQKTWQNFAFFISFCKKKIRFCGF